MTGDLASFAHEIASGDRFEFGENWRRFLAVVDEERIVEAERSLEEMLGVDSLAGKTFLDIGCGSGLFSLAAVRLGASRVHSIDYDPYSVACATELKRRHAPNDCAWTVGRASVLDRGAMTALGRWDLVYSWGVLHHTGDLRSAMESAGCAVTPGGTLFIAVYNDQGRATRWWKTIKRAYNALPRSLRLFVLVPCFVRLWGPTLLRDSLRGRPLSTWRAYSRRRGMSAGRDVVDWVGGWPFEAAKPEEVFDYYRARGFELVRLKTRAGSHGCNEFVFVKKDG